jgi:toxin ParE1/3/4
MPGRGYRLTPRAAADLEEIWRYTFETWSIEQADRYIHNLVAAFSALAAREKIGRRADVREGYFKYAVGAHVIYFQESDASIDVIRVLHGRMDADRHL